jgi:hypothetical protein
VRYNGQIVVNLMTTRRYFAKNSPGNILSVDEDVFNWYYIIVLAVIEKNRNIFWKFVSEVFPEF